VVLQRVGGAVRTSLLRFALPSFVFAIGLVVFAPVTRAASLSWKVETSPSSITVTPSPSGDKVIATGASYQYAGAPGDPLLPYRIINILLAPGETVVHTDVTAGEDIVVARNAKPARVPLAPDADTAPVASAYTVETAYPAERVVYLGVGHLHGYAIASFAVYPVRVENGVLSVNPSLELRITTGPDTSGETIATRNRLRDGFRADVERTLDELVVNPEQTSLYTERGVRVKKAAGGFQPTSSPSLEGSDVDYVIITNDSLAATFQTLADWKTAKGVPTVVRTTEWIEANYKNGVDPAETIRTFILDAYQDWGIKYALLGGDTDQIPARLGRSTYLGVKDLPADMYFGCLDGDWNADHDRYFGETVNIDQTDLYPEVYTGRLPAVNNAAAATLIAKIKSYETPIDPSYTGSSLLLAEVLFPIDWNTGQAIQQDGADIAEYLYLLAFNNPSLTVSKYYQNYVPHPGSLPENTSSVITQLNAGWDQVNDTGHGFRFNMSVGDGSVVNSDADALTNTNRYSNLFLLNCTAVAFTYFCLGEHFLLNPSGGAVSVIGSAESVYPLISQPYMNEYYRLLYVDQVEHIGEAFARSKYPRTPLAQSSTDNADLWTHYVYNVLADPEMPVWTAPVKPLTVVRPSSLGRGKNNVGIYVSDVSGAVANARVCLSKDDEDYEVGVTNALGNVTLPMTVESGGNVRIVVTALNHGRYDQNIPVSAASAPYVVFNGDAVDDDANGGTVGNADGVIDAGETIDLFALVKNTGATTASNVTLALRTSVPGVTITDSLATVGNVLPGVSKTATDPFRIVLSAALADQAPVKFTLVEKTNGVPTWTDTFTRVMHAPRMEFSVITINDTGTGNGDGVVQAGETFRLLYRVKNYGTGAGHVLNATLSDVSGGNFTILDNTDTYGDVASMASAQNTDGFLLSESSVAAAHNLQLNVTDASGRLWQKTFELRPPSPPVNMTCDPSLGPDRLSLTWDPPAGATDIDRYQVYRADAPGGDYALVSADPVRHTLLLDRGLLPTTRYYYKVTSLDASGNESAPSAEFTASTNPAQVHGWPITMTAETVSSPVMGDIDGDHTNELVVGDNKIYAWHSNGVEVRDGDDNAQTWGLFSTLGSSFVSHIALADIDNVPGLDILAASRDTKQIFAFSYTGNVIAGWPRLVINAIRAGLVAADIDGDGQREVIAIDEKGVLYVWHKDGTEFRDGDHDSSTNGVFRKFAGCTYQYGCPAVGDIDHDGINDIVVGTQGDSLFVIRSNGTSAPGWPKSFPSPIAGSPAIGDVDGDGFLDIVVHEQNGNTWAFKGDGTQLWFRWAPDNLSFSPSPALGDLDNDGKLECVIPGKDRLCYAIRWNGTDLPGWPVTYASTSWTESSPVIADIDNNGVLDVILGNENKFITGWDATGTPLAGFPLAMSDAVRATPLIADLDKDGSTDVVAAGWDKTVRVWDFPKMFNPLKAPWAKYHANLYNDGNVTTKLPTPVGGAIFGFAVHSGRVNLTWSLPLDAGDRFSVDRAEVVAGVASSYHRVASNLVIGLDGVVRLAESDLAEGARYTFRLVNEKGVVVHETASLYVPVERAGLGQNYPNPFNPSTKIEYWIPDGRTAEPVSLTIYDVRGARVRTLVDTRQPAGRYRVEWDGRDNSGTPVGSGIYFYRLATSHFSGTRKMILLK
jgi:hypothetical protein